MNRIAMTRIDNREFGRRRSLIHALIVSKRGLKETCLVRNISMGGALLEVKAPMQIPQWFKLIIEADSFEADCNLRHRTAHGVGVYFDDVRIDQSGHDTRYDGPKLFGPTAPIMISNLAPMDWRA